jgi:type I restriction enzyme S subunit
MSSRPKPNSVKVNGEHGLVPMLRFPAFRPSPAWDLKRGDALFDAVNNRSAAHGLPVLAITQEHGAIPRDHIDYHVSATAESIATYKEVCVGDFIISLRSFQGGIEYSRFHGICSPAYVILRRKGDGSDEYFRHFFKSRRFIQQLNRNIEGLRDGKMVSYAQFSEQLLPVPEPSEQRKIGKCLTLLDELIAAHGSKLDALRVHKRGLTKYLFPLEGNTLPRLRFPEFRDGAAWEARRVDAWGDVQAGKALAADAPGELRPYLRTKNVLDGAIDLADVLAMPMTDDEFSRFEILDGDVLLNEGQALDLVGRTSIYRGEFGGRCAMQNQLLRFRANPSTCAEFAAQAFRHYQMNGTFASIATKTTSVAHLGGSRLCALTVTWPPLLAEQQRIADCLDSADIAIAAEAAALNALKAHKSGLIQLLFPSTKEARA